MKTNNVINILVADDHPLFRTGVKQTLIDEEGFNVVGEAKNGCEAFEIIKNENPDIAILDIQMPCKTGLDVLIEIEHEQISTKVILLTMFKNPNYFYQAISLGAKGYILKENAIDDLIESVKIVNANGTFICKSLSHFVARQKISDEYAATLVSSLNSLTESEKQVLRLIAEWKTNKEIGDELFISPRTVGSHRNHISEKLNLSGTHSLIKFAIENKNLFGV